MPSAVAQPETHITMEPGQSELLHGVGITRTAVSDPSIVDIVPVSTTEVLVNAIKEGTSTVRIWDKQGLWTYNYTVAKPVIPEPEPVQVDLAALATEHIGIPTIKASMIGETLVLSGTAPSEEIAKKALIIGQACTKNVVSIVSVQPISTDDVVSSLRLALPDEPLTYEVLPDQTILIRGSVPTIEQAVRIQDVIQAWLGTPFMDDYETRVTTEINFTGQLQPPPEISDTARTIAREVVAGDVVAGEEFNIVRQVFGGRIPNGPRVVAILEVNPALARQIMVTAQVLEINRDKLKQLGVEWGELVGGLFTDQPFLVFEDRVPPVPLDEGGPFRRRPLATQIRALINEDAARILSQPQVLIVDGHTANILVGGEIPIPVAQNVSIGTSSITVMFKPFGVQLAVRPRITQDERILLTVTPEVSSLDFTNAVETSDFVIPALRTRRATTTVHMKSGESLIIGGLLSSADTKSIERIPLLSKIPVIGELFKSRSFQKEETELVILITPVLQDELSNAAPDSLQVPPPPLPQ